MSINQCDARKAQDPTRRTLSLFLVVKQGFPGRAGAEREPYSNNTKWVRTWAQIQMEASGSSPLRISDQVDRTKPVLPAESWALC